MEDNVISDDKQQLYAPRKFIENWQTMDTGYENGLFGDINLLF